MRFTDPGIRALPAPTNGQKTYYDDTLPSFGCRVSQGGTRSFFVQLGSDRRFVTIGRYHPDILPLAKARAEAKRILAEHVLGKHRPQSVAFDEAKELYLAEAAQNNRPKTVYEYRRVLNRHFNFTKRVADVTPSDIQRRLDRLTDTPAEQRYAIRCIKMFMRWCERRHYVETSPAARLLLRVQSTSRTRVLSDDELKCIWRACDGFGRCESTRLPLPSHFATIVKLLILTGQRRGEIAQLQSSWLDLENKTLTIPANIAKNARESVIPLCASSAALLAPLLRKQPPANGYIFSARTPTSKPFNGWSKAKEQLDKLSGVDGWTIHDLRRTFATRLAEMGVAPHVIERLLNHITGTISGISAVYNRAKYAEEMRSAIEAWEARVQEILSGEMGREAR
jgi:integrase